MKLKSLVVAALLPATAFAADEMNTKIFGYINGYWETVQDQPLNNGTTGNIKEKANNPEYNVPNVHLMVNSEIGKFRTFLNMAAPSAEGVQVNNAWVEGQIFDQYLKFRLGKLYRPFDLYNEILDATPTYIGIEPPELFDQDHNFLTRTTNAMLGGQAEMGSGTLHYAITTGNDERESNQVPLGADVYYTMGADWKVGASYYNSNGWAKPLVTNDQTSGEIDGNFGGVLPWMARDKFNVMGAYAQYTKNSIIFQVAGYASKHEGQRNSQAVSAICGASGANLNQRQRDRFNCGGTINTNANYTAQTFYTRLGYSFNLNDWGTLTPYLQYDQFKNEETIGNKDFGGDNEAGISDDGQFQKYTAGLFYQPVYAVAIKTDYSRHNQLIGGKDTSYGEGRVSFSYFFRFN